jgi:hypothetical protein
VNLTVLLSAASTNNQTTTNSNATNVQYKQMLADDTEQNTDRDMSWVKINFVKFT